MQFNDDWEREAENWIAWARAPGHDAYWQYRDAFFELVPARVRGTLEIGCGEGRVTRDLAERGHKVIGVDAARVLSRRCRNRRCRTPRFTQTRPNIVGGGCRCS